LDSAQTSLLLIWLHFFSSIFLTQNSAQSVKKVFKSQFVLRLNNNIFFFIEFFKRYSVFQAEAERNAWFLKGISNIFWQTKKLPCHNEGIRLLFYLLFILWFRWNSLQLFTFFISTCTALDTGIPYHQSITMIRIFYVRTSMYIRLYMYSWCTYTKNIQDIYYEDPINLQDM